MHYTDFQFCLNVRSNNLGAKWGWQGWVGNMGPPCKFVGGVTGGGAGGGGCGGVPSHMGMECNEVYVGELAF